MTSHGERLAYIRAGPYHLRLMGQKFLVEVERVFVPTLYKVDVTRLVTLLDSSGLTIYSPERDSSGD